MGRLISWWIFCGLGFYLSGVLSILPLAPDYQWLRPQWMLMYVIFCQLVNTKAFNPVVAWFIGLLFDSLLGTPLGEYALVFTVISYLTLLLRERFIKRSLWQHVGKIFLLVCLGQIFILWFHALAGKNPHTLLYWAGSMTSALAWPFFVAIMFGLGRPFRISFSPRSIV